MFHTLNNTDFKSRVWRCLRVHALALLATLGLLTTEPAQAGCLADCTPRIGIVSAFGAEADILVARTEQRRDLLINGNRFTTGVLEGNAVVIVLSGVSMVNASMATQLMLDHFNVERLVMSGIAGGIDPGRHVGDVLVPERWAMPMEVYWSPDGRVPAPCGAATDVSCLGLKLRTGPEGRPLPEFSLPTSSGALSTGLFIRENFVMRADTAPQGEFRFDYVADPQMLAVARALKPELSRCGPKQAGACVDRMPELVVGGRSVSGTAFLANPDYRRYLFDTLQAGAVDMETAAFAHVAHANRVPFVAFRSLSDLAGGDHTREVGAFFGSGLAEANASAVTLAFLRAWRAQHGATQRASAPVAESSGSVLAPKVIVVTMFPPEAEPWITTLGLTQDLPIDGLRPEHPALKCNAQGVCLVITGMGHANAAASTLAVALSPKLDLRKSYWIVSGIAGIDPNQGTLGSAAWARWLIDFGIAHEIDAREMPRGWRTGYLGVMTKGPNTKPAFDYRTEVFRLNEPLLQQALRLSRGVPLTDSAEAQAYRRRYPQAKAKAKPTVMQCDTLAGDTWYHGRLLAEHAARWTKLLSDGQASYCTTQQEDNATADALARATAAGRADVQRLAVLRTASNFDRPYPGQSAWDSLKASTSGATGGFLPATRNGVIAAGPLVQDIVQRWDLWREGVPRQ
jgi:adenosylhomocysteine nucleosidase